MKTTAILGASGYTGAEMIRLVMGHPRLNLVALTGDSRAGQTAGEVHPALAGHDLPGVTRVDEVDWSDIDVVFACLPHGASQDIISRVAPEVETVIDLSADFRLKDPTVYEENYGRAHDAPDLLERAVYGLSEWVRDDLPGAALVACPGCYPTCSLLALAPLAKAGLIEFGDIRITALSGVSGAGRKAAAGFAYSELSDSTHAYGIGTHRHAPEIDAFLGEAAGEEVEVSFTPHLVPMNRGMTATIYVEALASVRTLRDALRDAYADAPFVQLLPDGLAPKTRDVRGSNLCRLNIFPDRQSGRAILVSAIDNLTKGSSGQALQNYNLVQGWDETTGLEMAPLFP